MNLRKRPALSAAIVFAAFLLLAVLLRRDRSEFVVASGLYACGRIDIHRNLVVWGAPPESDSFVPAWATNEGLGIFAFDLEKKKLTSILEDSYQVNAAVFDLWIVWEYDLKGIVSIYVHDLKTAVDSHVWGGGREPRWDPNFIMKRGFRQISGYDPNATGGESIRRSTTNPFDKPAAAGKLRTGLRGFSTDLLARALQRQPKNVPDTNGSSLTA